MVTFEKGKAVFVRTGLFQDTAILEEYFPKELVPIAVVLDKGDEDGHRYKRVRPWEVYPIEQAHMPFVLTEEPLEMNSTFVDEEEQLSLF